MSAIEVSAARERRAAQLPATTAARWGAWLLTLSPAYFVLIVVVNIGVLATNAIPPFAEIARADMDRIAVGWVLLSVLYALAFVLGCTGVALLGGSLATRGIARGWGWSATTAAVVAIVLYLPYAPFRIDAMGFTESRLGQNAWYAFWDPMTYVAQNLAIAGVVLLCIAMFAGTGHRLAAIIIGASAVVYLITAVAQLPLPPFVISFLWCAVGIVWLRSNRRAGRDLE